MLKVLADGCDVLVIPTTADGLSFDALMLTVEALREVEATRYRILVTMTPPKPSRDGEIAQEALIAQGLPVFANTIRHLKAFKTAGTQGRADFRRERSAGHDRLGRLRVRGR